MTRKKLSLNKETLRTLSDAKLENIRGGEEAILSIGACSGHATCRQNSGCDGSKCGQMSCNCFA